MKYAKAIVAIVGAGITAALGIVSPGTELFQILTIAAAIITAAGVYLVPNASNGVIGVDLPSGGDHVAE